MIKEVGESLRCAHGMCLGCGTSSLDGGGCGRAFFFLRFVVARRASTLYVRRGGVSVRRPDRLRLCSEGTDRSIDEPLTDGFYLGNLLAR
eukprot:5699266-Prymnesium_polylepis.1